MKQSYDYVIVGAGSAGCAVANRLSADPQRSVLLIESGPADKSMFVRMPRGLGILNNPGSKHIWEYQVDTGNPGANAPGEEERWFRGRTLGGSSAVNGMIYMRGAPLDYDGWEKLGCEGWGWTDVLPKFIELENHDLGAGEARGGAGAQRITTHAKGEPLFEALIRAGEEMGIARVEDVNDPVAVREGGIAYQTSTRHKGERHSSARSFLEPVRSRPNLTVATETEVLRILFEGKRASGVVLRDKDGERPVRATREVVLSAGAFNTPKLLQLSGIGPRPLLEGLGIPVVVDAPEVGRNLREHRHVDLRLRVRSGSQNKDLSGWRAGLSMLRYLLLRKGPMTHPAHEVGAFAKSDDSLDHADLQFGVMTVSVTSMGKHDDIALESEPGITFVTYFTRPDSQGELAITSADPAVPPRIAVNHLATERDRERFVAAFRWNRRLAAQPALAPFVVGEVYPGPEVETDEQILDKAMELGGSCFHNSGTARMGSDPAAVTDPRLRVRGVEGLRVADTSIFPTMVSGNTNGPAMMVGLRAAEFILADEAGQAAAPAA